MMKAGQQQKLVLERGVNIKAGFAGHTQAGLVTGHNLAKPFV